VLQAGSFQRAGESIDRAITLGEIAPRLGRLRDSQVLGRIVAEI
jgi:hypothetical protein